MQPDGSAYSLAGEPLLPAGDQEAAHDAEPPADCLGPPSSDGDRTREGHQTADLSQTPSRGRWSLREHRQLGLFSVTMIIFFNVSGGPLGSESAIRHANPNPNPNPSPNPKPSPSPIPNHNHDRKPNPNQARRPVRGSLILPRLRAALLRAPG